MCKKNVIRENSFDDNNAKTACYFCQSLDSLTLDGMAHKPVILQDKWLSSVSISWKQQCTYSAIRPGINEKYIGLNVIISSFCHHNKLTPVSLARIPRVNDCMWGEEGPENTSRSTGVVAARLKNEWKTFFFFFFAYAIQPAQSLDPHRKVPARAEKSFLHQFSSSSVRTYLCRQWWFAAERKYQTCATQENGSPALQLDDLGSDGRENLSRELPC